MFTGRQRAGVCHVGRKRVSRLGVGGGREVHRGVQHPSRVGVLRRHPDAGCKAHGNKGRVCVPARPGPAQGSATAHRHGRINTLPVLILLGPDMLTNRFPTASVARRRTQKQPPQCELVHVKMAAAFPVKPARNGNATWRLPRPAVAPGEPDGTYGPSEGKPSSLKKGRAEGIATPGPPTHAARQTLFHRE